MSGRAGEWVGRSLRPNLNNHLCSPTTAGVEQIEAACCASNLDGKAVRAGINFARGVDVAPVSGKIDGPQTRIGHHSEGHRVSFRITPADTAPDRPVVEDGGLLHRVGNRGLVEQRPTHHQQKAFQLAGEAICGQPRQHVPECVEEVVHRRVQLDAHRSGRLRRRGLGPHRSGHSSGLRSRRLRLRHRCGNPRRNARRPRRRNRGARAGYRAARRRQLRRHRRRHRQERRRARRVARSRHRCRRPHASRCGYRQRRSRNAARPAYADHTLRRHRHR